MPLSDEEKATLEALQKKAEEKDEPKPGTAQSLVTNVTIDLDNPEQVKRAVKSGLLPASYLEDDDDPPADDDPPDDEPARRTRF